MKAKGMTIPGDSSGVRIWCELVTGDRADELLKLNTNNRDVRREHVTNLKHVMESGKFVLMPAPVVIGKNGVILDSQHRLIAISETGIPQWMYIMDNVDESIFDKFDAGLGRKNYDHAKIAGVIDNTRVVDHMATGLINFKRNKRSTATNSGSNTKNRVEPYELLQFIRDNAEVKTAAAELAELWHVKHLHIRIMAIPFYLYRNFVDQDGVAYGPIVSDFFRKFHSGENMTSGDPVLVLKRTLEDDAAKSKNAMRLTNAQKINLFFLALSLHIQGKKVDKLRWRGEGIPKLVDRNGKDIEQKLIDQLN